MKIAGFGFRTSATLADLEAVLALAGGPVDAIATVAEKAQSAPFVALAQNLGVPARAIPAETLARQTTLSHSPTVERLFGTGSLAEAAALAAAGRGARLLGPRSIAPTGKATAAIAEGPDP